MTKADRSKISIDPSMAKSSFVAGQAKKSLRVTCYGSSSAKTPEDYLREARSLGYILAKRGHICVNGAGSYGCMAAMNDGAVAGNGHIIGVIHEMFLVDDGYGGKTIDRDGGAHPAFQNVKSSHKIPIDQRRGPIREIRTASGMDLQERKKMLVEKADGLIVLPGGPGTWDELWEMSCARHLGLIDLPIVCVNVNGYYEPFREMLQRAYKDELIKLPPQQIAHFVSTSEEAVRWLEAEKAGTGDAVTTKNLNLERRTSALKRSSFMSSDVTIFKTISRASSIVLEETSRFLGLDGFPASVQLSLTFVFGAMCGAAVAFEYIRRPKIR